MNVRAADSPRARVGSSRSRGHVVVARHRAPRRRSAAAARPERRTAAAAPKPGGAVTYGLEAETGGGCCPPTARLAISGHRWSARAIYDTLTVPNAKDEMVPYLAKSVDAQRRLHRVDDHAPRRHQVPRRHAARRRRGEAEHRRLAQGHAARRRRSSRHRRRHGRSTRSPSRSPTDGRRGSTFAVATCTSTAGSGIVAPGPARPTPTLRRAT